MKYELIPKDKLDEALEAILEASRRFAIAYSQDQNNQKLLDEGYAAKKLLEAAYNTIQTHRTQCNVQPEGAQ